MVQATENQNDYKKISDLEIENENHENYFSNTIIPQLFVDDYLILKKCSPAAIKHFGLAPNCIGQTMDESDNAIIYPDIITDIRLTILNQKILEREIMTCDRKHYQVNIIPYIIRKENKTNGVIITFIDVTERVRILQEAQDVNQSLVKLNTDHETFIYSVSHDLKAPVSNIKGLLLALKESAGSFSKEEYHLILDMLDHSAENLGKMMDELAEISKGNSDFKKDVEKVNFNEALEEVKLTLYDKIIETGATLETDFKEAYILFSKKNIRSVLYNLLSNAIKYGAPERRPQIYLKSQRVPGFVLLSVKDNGQGIEEDKKELIFSRFTRVLKNVEGTGIGLFLVAKIVDGSGGRIEVESQVGVGSVFKLYIKE